MRVMYVTTVPVAQYQVPDTFPLPAVGDTIELDERMYSVQSRVWSYEPRLLRLGEGNLQGSSIELHVAIHVREF